MTEEELLYRNDVTLLFGIMHKLTSFHDQLPQESRDEYLRYMLKLEDFVGIHNTRTADLINTMDRLNTARTEFRLMRSRLDECEKKLKEKDDFNERLITDILDV